MKLYKSMLPFDRWDLTPGQMEGDVHLRRSNQKALNVAFIISRRDRYFEVRKGKTAN